MLLVVANYNAPIMTQSKLMLIIQHLLAFRNVHLYHNIMEIYQLELDYVYLIVPIIRLLVSFRIILLVSVSLFAQ